MKTQVIFAASVAMLLAGCNENQVPDAPTNAASESAKDYDAEIAALPEGQRNAVFIRAIRDAGRECQRVERSAARPPVNGSAAWTATCDGGAEWIILPFGEGQAQVLSPAELQAASGEGSEPANETR